MVDATEVLEQAEKERDQLQDLLRPVAEFFHDHEGELFERYEAIEELQDHLDTDDERLIGKVLGNLCADRVDPVQNVVKDGGNWIGVIEYHEHDYWYEYVEHHDIDGRRNIGVCAKCVKESDVDTEVAKGVGDTEELADRIEDHYDEEHDGSVDVETGATLNSGTTIAGNAAIHSANDGLGSSLDADLLRGSHLTSYIVTGTTYNETFISAGGEAEYLTTPSPDVKGVGFEQDSSIWVVGGFSDPSAHKFSRTNSLITQFSAPSGSPQGIDADASDSLWIIDTFSDKIHETDQSGTVLSDFQTPSDSPQGLGVGNDGCIWHTDTTTDTIYTSTKSGNTSTAFAAPFGGISGIDMDTSGCIWMSDTLGSIFLADQTGTTESTYIQDGTLAEVGLDGDEVWIGEETSSIYRMSTGDEVKYE